MELQSGPRFSADPKAFAQALNLDHTIQQVRAALWQCLSLQGGFAMSATPKVQSCQYAEIGKTVGRKKSLSCDCRTAKSFGSCF